MQFNDMHEKRIDGSESSSEASDGSDTENDATTVDETAAVDVESTVPSTSHVAESSIGNAISTSG